VARVDATTGATLWSVVIRPPGVTATADPEPDLEVEPHFGYVIVTGSDAHRSWIAAISSSGRLGPVCTLPPFLTTDDHVELLPHAGVVIVSNPPSAQSGHGSSHLEGYATASGKRVWSVSTQSSQAAGGASFIVADDVAYVWQGSDGEIAAYDVRTGHQRWKVNSGTIDPGYQDNGLLAVLGDRVYALVDRDSVSWLEALRTSNGKRVWTRIESAYAEPGYLTINQIDGDELLLQDSPAGDSSASSGETYLLDARTGRPLAHQPIVSGDKQICYPGGQLAVALLGDKRIYLLSADPRYERTISVPAGVDPYTGTVEITASQAYVRIPRRGEPILGYDLATGRLLWKVKAPGSPPDVSLLPFDGGFGLGSSGGAIHLFS
jgi:PQQ-like domain